MHNEVQLRVRSNVRKASPHKFLFCLLLVIGLENDNIFSSIKPKYDLKMFEDLNELYNACLVHVNLFRKTSPL